VVVRTRVRWFAMVLPLKVKHPDVWQRTDPKRKTVRVASER
jgi:hypothetical protein